MENDYIGCTPIGMPIILEYPSECKSWFYANGVTKPNYPVPAIPIHVEWNYYEQANQDRLYVHGKLPPRYPVPALYTGPNNPAYWVIDWLTWVQAKEYIALRNKQYMDQ